MSASRRRNVPKFWKSSAANLPTAGLANSRFFHGQLSAPISSERKRLIVENPIQGVIAMHFCLTGQYTPRAVNNLLENPTQNRAEAARKLVEAAGGKLVSFYGMPVEGPGVLTIFDVPDPSSASAITGIVVAAGTLQNVKLVRLLTQEEVVKVRQTANKLKGSYTGPGN
jgi:uncharacterized protein with GYD domain